MDFTKSKHFWRLPVYLFYATLVFGSFSMDIFSIIGTAIAAAGVVLYYLSRRELGKNYSSSPSIARGHVLVTTGPFRYVRHPGYVGSFLAMLGFIMISKSAASLAFCLLVCVPFGFYKIRYEEKMLLEKFGKRFVVYRKRVSKVFPRIANLSL